MMTQGLNKRITPSRTDLFNAAVMHPYGRLRRMAVESAAPHTVDALPRYTLYPTSCEAPPLPPVQCSPNHIDAMKQLPSIYQEDGLSKQLRGSICTVLCRYWDPLGIGTGPYGRGLYRRHVPALFIMLVDGFTSADIAAYLDMVRQEYPVREDTPIDGRLAAEALCALRVPYGLTMMPPAAVASVATRHT